MAQLTYDELRLLRQLRAAADLAKPSRVRRRIDLGAFGPCFRACRNSNLFSSNAMRRTLEFNNENQGRYDPAILGQRRYDEIKLDHINLTKQQLLAQILWRNVERADAVKSSWLW